MSSASTPCAPWQNWSADEEALLVSLVESGMTFNDIAKCLPKRTSESCRGHYYPRLHWQKLMDGQEHDRDDRRKGFGGAEDGSDSEDFGHDTDSQMLHGSATETGHPPRYISAFESGFVRGSVEVDSKPLTSVPSVSPEDHHHSRPKSWDPKETALLLKLKADGVTFETITRHLPGRSYRACRSKYNSLLKAGDHLALASMSARKPWSAAEHEILVDARKRGLSFLEIQKQLPGRTLKACRNFSVQKHRRQHSSTTTAGVKDKIMEVDTISGDTRALGREEFPGGADKLETGSRKL